MDLNLVLANLCILRVTIPRILKQSFQMSYKNKHILHTAGKTGATFLYIVNVGYRELLILNLQIPLQFKNIMTRHLQLRFRSAKKNHQVGTPAIWLPCPAVLAPVGDFVES